MRRADFTLNMRNGTSTHPAVRDDRARAIGLDRRPEQRRSDLPLIRNIDHGDQPRGVKRDDSQPALVEIDALEFLIFLGLQYGEQKFLWSSAQLIDDLVIGKNAVGEIDDMILIGRILHQITGAADIFRVKALLLHRIDFLQERTVGHRAQENELLAAQLLRSLNLQIEQRSGEQRKQRDRAVPVEIVFCEGNQCQFHEYGGPER